MQCDPVAFRVDEYSHISMFRGNLCFGNDNLAAGLFNPDPIRFAHPGFPFK